MLATTVVDPNDRGSLPSTSTSAAPPVKCMSMASFFGGGSSEPSVVDLAQSASTNARKRQRAKAVDGENDEGEEHNSFLSRSLIIES